MHPSQAAHCALLWHQGQNRKYTGEPYITHCSEVASLVHNAGLDDEVVAAAWLHDVVEDTGVSLQMIETLFGWRVRQLVYEVTEVSRPEDGNRAIRKRIDREHYAKASPEGKAIKLADLISNTRSIVEHDPNFAKVYLAEKRLLLPHLRAHCAAPVLYTIAWNRLEDAERKLENDLLRSIA